MKNQKYTVIGVMLFVVLIDQLLKIYVKCNFSIGSGFDMLGISWAKIHFVENQGMAFGMEFGGKYGKLILSIFRLIATGALIYFIFGKIKSNSSKVFLVGLALIASGALGNMIDSIFYGVIFSASTYNGGEIATMFPADGGYAPLFAGKVVDMFYFPIIDTQFPSWMPFVGDRPFRFNRYIFNLADLAITVGVILVFFTLRKKKNIESGGAEIAAES